MKPKTPTLPPELRAFIDAGNTTFHCDDGDWDLRICDPKDYAKEDDVPPRSTVIAENGCGDYLFLQKSAAGKFDPRVFVFWHEEEGHEPFAANLKDLMRPASHATPAPSGGTTAKRNAVPLKQLETALASPKIKTRDDAIRKFKQTTFGVEALPALRRALADTDPGVVIHAAECIAKLGPEARSCPAAAATIPFDGGDVDLEWQLILVSSKVWQYSGYANCYSACLNALVKIEVDEETILEHVHAHIGLSCQDDLLDSLNALKTIGTPEALDLLKRAAVFWLPELNMKYAKEVQKLVAASGRPKK